MANHTVATAKRVLVPKRLIEPYLIERYEKVDSPKYHWRLSGLRLHEVAVRSLVGYIELLSEREDIGSRADEHVGS